MNPKHVFTLIRNYREEKRLRSIKLRELTKGHNRRSWNEEEKEEPEQVRRGKMIAKRRDERDECEPFKRQLSLLTSSSLRETRPVVDEDPFIEVVDESPCGENNAKGDCQESVTTEDPVLSLDSYFTF